MNTEDIQYYYLGLHSVSRYMAKKKKMIVETFLYTMATASQVLGMYHRPQHTHAHPDTHIHMHTQSRTPGLGCIALSELS